MFAIQHLKHLALACVVAVGSFLGLAATPAHAIDTITCTGSAQTTFSPPITDQPSTVTFTSDFSYTPCISTVPGVTSGSRNITANVTRSCASLLETETVSSTINWNNGQSSTAQSTRVASLAGAAYTVTHTGTVTSGLFQGRSFVHQMTAPSTDILLCTLGLGDVATINYSVVLEIL